MWLVGIISPVSPVLVPPPAFLALEAQCVRRVETWVLIWVWGFCCSPEHSDPPGAKVPSDSGSVPVCLDWVSSSHCGSGVNSSQDSWDLEICPLEVGMSPFQRDASSESCIPEKAVCIYWETLLLWGLLTFLQSWIFLFSRCEGSPSSQGKVLLTR